MSSIVWNARGQHYYENGVDHGVLYPPSNTPNIYGKGVAWNGLTSVSNSPEGAELNAIYADDIKYLDIMSAEEFKATIEALDYPEEFNACDGKRVISGVYLGQQPRKPFCLSYRTRIGNDLSSKSGYKLHIVYNATVTPTEESYETLNDSPEPMTRSWEMETTPEGAPNGMEPTSHVILDSRLISSEAMKAIEDVLYGTENSDPRVLTPKELYEMLEDYVLIGIDRSATTFSVYCNVSDDNTNPRINWGDGETTLVTGSGTYSHNYSQHDNDLEVKIIDVTSMSIFNSTPEVKGFVKYAIINAANSIDNAAFAGCSNLASVTIGNSVIGIGNSAFDSCTNLTAVTIGNGVTSVGNNAFRDCTSLTSITIPDGVASISEYTFSGCSALTSITIPDSVASIGNYAFQNCVSLTSITIPNSVTNIGQYAFKGCTALTSIDIPNSVTSIGNYAFNGCTALTSFTIPNSVTILGSYAFDGCTSLASVTIGNGVTSINGHTFYNCTALTSINIPDSVTYIGDYAFTNCRSLTSVTIPDSVTEAKGHAFDGCTSLASVTIGNGLGRMEVSVFYNCTALTSINIPDSVFNIKSNAFYGCTSLTSVIIGKHIGSIEKNAFYNCSSLVSVTFTPGLSEVPYLEKSNAFSGNASGRKFYVQADLLDAWKAASNWSTYASAIEALP